MKIVTIGGGSSYTPELISGFIKRYKELPVTDFYLVDIEEGKEKLEIVGNFARRMVEEAGVNMKIHLTTNRREALKDADFVTTQLRVGQLEARISDEKIPLKYNILGQETTGPGGFAKALRTIPVLLDICKDMKEVCPEAWLINFTNPAGIVTEAIKKFTDIKTIGICSGANTMLMSVAEAYNIDKEKVYGKFVGLNHLVFGYQFFVDGKDITKDFIEKLASNGEKGFKNIPDIGFEPSFIRALNMFPIGYLKYYFLGNETFEIAKKDSETVGTRGEQAKKIEKELFELYKDKNLKTKPKQLEKRGGAFYSETACSVISAIHLNKKEIHVVNTFNNGAIKNLPDDAVIEINCVIDKNGASPITYGSLPPIIRGIIQQTKAYEELTVECAVSGDYNTALKALSSNPLVNSVTLARKLLDDILEANKKYLPQFGKYNSDIR